MLHFFAIVSQLGMYRKGALLLDMPHFRMFQTFRLQPHSSVEEQLVIKVKQRLERL